MWWCALFTYTVNKPMMLKVKRLALTLIVIALGFGTATGPSTFAQAPSATEAAQAIVEGTCQRCHNDRAHYGNMSLENLGAKNNHRCLSCQVTHFVSTLAFGRSCVPKARY